MTDAEYEPWVRAMAVSPKDGLATLLTRKVPAERQLDVAKVLFASVLPTIDRISASDRRQARQLYQQFQKALAHLDLTDAALSELVLTGFTSKPLERAFAKHGLTKKEGQDRKLLDAVQRNLHYALKRRGESGLSTWWLRPGNRKFTDNMATLLMMLATAGGASVALPYLVEEHPEKYFEVAADFSGAVYTIQGSEFLGYGLYFKMSDIEKVLGKPFHGLSQNLTMARRGSDRAAVEKAEDQLIRYLVTELYDDYDDATAEGTKPKTGAVPAERILRSSGCDTRGVCRHKALVLAAILNELGIEAAYEIGETPRSYHAWVVLLQRDVLVDPTWNVITTKDPYYDLIAKVARNTVSRPDSTKMIDHQY